MKKICILTALILSILCCSCVVYADVVNREDNIGLTLNPYKNFKNEGQISSNEIIIRNDKSIPQKISFRFIGKGSSSISLANKSVLYNDFGEEKVAFVHILDIDSNEKYLIYEENKNYDLGLLEPHESLSLKVCGELNVAASWEVSDSLELNIEFSSDDFIAEAKDIITSESSLEYISESEDVVTEISEENAVEQTTENISDLKEDISTTDAVIEDVTDVVIDSDAETANDSETSNDSNSDSNAETANDSTTSNDSDSNADITNDSEASNDSDSNADVTNDSEASNDSDADSNADITNDSETSNDSNSDSDAETANDSETSNDSNSDSETTDTSESFGTVEN